MVIAMGALVLDKNFILGMMLDVAFWVVNRLRASEAMKQTRNARQEDEEVPGIHSNLVLCEKPI